MAIQWRGRDGEAAIILECGVALSLAAALQNHAARTSDLRNFGTEMDAAAAEERFPEAALSSDTAEVQLSGVVLVVDPAEARFSGVVSDADVAEACFSEAVSGTDAAEAHFSAVALG